jgi:hypothetical protein
VPSRNLNGSVAGGVLASCNADVELWACDALPPALKALIKDSFVNTKASTVLAQWRELEAQGVPLAAYVHWFAQRLAVNQAKSCEVAYGPGHPQAQPPPPPPRQLSRPEDEASRARAARRAAEIRLDYI